MTVPIFGRITVLQRDMLGLAGVLRTLPEIIPTEAERTQEMIRARANLKKITGRDFGYDLQAWHNFLLASDECREGYTFHYAWRGVRSRIEQAMKDAGRLSLAASLEANQSGFEE